MMPDARSTTRRHVLLSSGGGIGWLALTALLHDDVRGAIPEQSRDPLVGLEPHFAPRAKRVIWLFMHGGPSHLDLFDYKPALVRHAGEPLPTSFGSVMTRRDVAANGVMPPVRPFRPRGAAGIEISDFLPHLAQCADELCLIRSCHGDSVNHPQSVYQLNTGSVLMGKPSMGSWVAYGLGSENQNMPAFVVLPQSGGGGGVKGGPPAWGSGFLPAAYQGTLMRAGENPILYLQPPPGMSRERQRGVLDLARRLNHQHLVGRDSDSGLSARIAAYELAFRMQSTAPQLVDLSGESVATKELYGLHEADTREFGTRCLLARRMVERGVRFVQLYSGNTGGWDAHGNVEKNHSLYCRRTDRPIAGLLIDLKSRGLLEDTLVIWGGEFGRMPMNEGGAGRDHNPWGFSYWLAGGGVKAGTVYGATDEFGLRAAEDQVHVHDLHATILHLLGLDHEQLTFTHKGREERLTDVHGNVVREILA